MTPSLPLCCTSESFRLFAGQVHSLDSSEALLRAAVAVSRNHLNETTAADVSRVIDDYAKVIKSRVRGTQTQAMVAHLHHYLFDELGFVGNAEDYYNPANSYLPMVLESRQGLPITLSMVYKLTAERCGLTVKGVGLPGHFLTSVQTETGPMFVDCYAGGRVMSVDECKERVESIFADTVGWCEQMLEPVTHRMWLSRMIQNLLHIFTTNQDWADVAAMLELQMLLWPNQSHLQRDLGLVLARIDMPKPASAFLGEYLKSNPNDPERDELAELLHKLAK